MPPLTEPATTEFATLINNDGERSPADDWDAI
jgi:hypothetical protein